MAEIVIKHQIADSVLPYPEGLWERMKYYFWKCISPGYTFGRDLLLALGFIHHGGRQNYLLGRLRPDRKIEDFLKHIAARGFGNHFIAWTDDGEVASLRLLDGFHSQYHLRMFDDGEVRGHYEYTPEAHPVWHLKEVGMQPCFEKFQGFLGDWIVPAPVLVPVSLSEAAPAAASLPL